MLLQRERDESERPLGEVSICLAAGRISVRELMPRPLLEGLPPAEGNSFLPPPSPSKCRGRLPCEPGGKVASRAQAQWKRGSDRKRSRLAAIAPRVVRAPKIDRRRLRRDRSLRPERLCRTLDPPNGPRENDLEIRSSDQPDGDRRELAAAPL